MKRLLTAVGLATLFFALTLTNGTPNASAQSPIQEVLDTLTKQGATYRATGLQQDKMQRYFGMCILQVTFPSTDYQGGPAVSNLSRITGLTQSQIFNAGYAVGRWTGTQYIVDFAVDASFCNPPSGDAKAQNPVPEPLKSTHGDPVIWGAVGLAILAGFLFFPPFRRVFVRI